VCILAW